MNAASNFAAASLSLTDSLLFRWLLLLAAICAVIAGVLIGWRRLRRWMDAEIATAVEEAFTCEDYDFLLAAPEFIETPIYDATIAHVAARAAVDLDDEWARISGGGWSA